MLSQEGTYEFGIEFFRAVDFLHIYKRQYKIIKFPN